MNAKLYSSEKGLDLQHLRRTTNHSAMSASPIGKRSVSQHARESAEWLHVEPRRVREIDMAPELLEVVVCDITNHSELLCPLM